jgi:hypothetical protein
LGSCALAEKGRRISASIRKIRKRGNIFTSVTWFMDCGKIRAKTDKFLLERI